MTPQNCVDIITFASIIGGVCLVLSLIMMIITWQYVNRSKKRRRLIELIWGRSNDWYEGKPFDFFMANYVISGCIFVAWRFKHNIVTKNQRHRGAVAYPNLHFDGNYLKLLNEFKFLTHWETVKIFMIFLFAIGGAITL